MRWLDGVFDTRCGPIVRVFGEKMRHGYDNFSGLPILIHAKIGKLEGVRLAFLFRVNDRHTFPDDAYVLFVDFSDNERIPGSIS